MSLQNEDSDRQDVCMEKRKCGMRYNLDGCLAGPTLDLRKVLEGLDLEQFRVDPKTVYLSR